MPRNTIADLNNHLFEQLERLNDDSLSEEDLDRELKRAKGMTAVAAQIIETGELAFKTMVRLAEAGYNGGTPVVPAMLAPKDGKPADDK